MKYNFWCQLFFIAIFTGCNVNDGMIETISKSNDSDLFKNTIVESQIYKINASEENVIESSHGNLVIIPHGTFVDNQGKIVSDSIDIELAEATEFDEIIFSNLAMQDSINQYEQYQAFFINATRKGQQLAINPDLPLYIELPANKEINLYRGRRDLFGNMSWDSVISPLKNLIPVPLESIDFLPPNFEIEVEKGLPYRNHEVVTKNLLDSLYYSFATDLNESGYLAISSDKLLCINLFMPLMKIFFQEEAINDSVALEYEAFETYLFGINPASIKAIRNKKFQNTLISTREFEARLKTIFASCNNNVLELYVKNLNKNLWEIDEMAANMLGKSHELYSKFKEYASYKQTTIKVTDKKAELLANHYEKSKSKIEEELLRLKKEFLASKKKEQEFSKKKQEEYKALLTKRQEYRMQKFGFELKEVGWYNAARKIKLEEIEKFELNIKISNGNQYDRVYAYVIDQRINSIYSCLAKDKVHFDYVYQEDPYLILLKGQEFKIIGVGYKNEIVGNKLETFKQQKVVEAQLELEDDTQKEFKQTLKHYTRGYKKENKIIVDLEYQAFFYQKQKQKEKEIAEMEFRNQLYDAVFPCDFKEDTAVSEVNLLDQIAGN